MTEAEKLLKELSAALKDSKSFFVAQSPDTIKQVIGEGILNCIFTIGVSLLFNVLLCAGLFYTWESKVLCGSAFRCGNYDFILLILGVFEVFSFIILSTATYGLISIKLYPKEYLLNYFLHKDK